ncbi:GTP-binding protein [Cohnella sp. WQ 127256]|uniref:CobW family GTP-binding protein n=1 Tax=Cohnella sp. WQ 127256 TaxID=2938790 RepID=UPI002118446E|nr:GTP-binding protein [Cohnella sp. WQ 127256]
MNHKVIPVYVLAGFLGSGKSTLLNLLLEDAKLKGWKPAILMNEVGDVNVEGQLIEKDIPMAEMLGGCICCTIRADLGMELVKLAQEHRPDVIWIESTGIAQPLEIMDAVTEASLYEKLELKGVVTVVDSRHLLDRVRIGSGKTFKLMKEQIHSASVLVLNKTDLVGKAEQAELEQLLGDWNPHALLVTSVKAQMDAEVIYSLDGQRNGYEHPHGHSTCSSDCEQDHEHKHDHEHIHDTRHDHVNTLTYYVPESMDSHEFEAFVRQLPEGIYRAKGIVTFHDTASRFLFQYAYRESDYLRITPQKIVHDVVVFIGEGFSKQELLEQLESLTKREM